MPIVRILADMRERICRGSGGGVPTPAIDRRNLSILGADLDDGMCAEDGVSSLMGSSFYRFEKEGRGGPIVRADESPICKYRSELVGKDTDPDWDHDNAVPLILGIGDGLDKLVEG